MVDAVQINPIVHVEKSGHPDSFAPVASDQSGPHTFKYSPKTSAAAELRLPFFQRAHEDHEEAVTNMQASLGELQVNQEVLACHPHDDLPRRQSESD